MTASKNKSREESNKLLKKNFRDFMIKRVRLSVKSRKTYAERERQLMHSQKCLDSLKRRTSYRNSYW
jgi:hypothetical protein